MDAQDSIGLSHFTNFLESGAILRIDPEAWLLLQGPFTRKNFLNADELALYQPDFFQEGPDQFLIPEAFYQLTTRNLQELCQSWLRTHTAEAGPWNWQAPDPQDFATAFQDVQARLRQGTLTKAVPIAFESSSKKPGTLDLARILLALSQAPPRLYPYGSWQESRGIIGASPEILLRQQGSSLQTMALAGTCPKEEAAQRRPLLEDPKERHEHDLVVQDIVQSLQRYGSIQQRGPRILELPTLLHLQTEIDCQLTAPSEFSFFNACRELHPTPALGVAPRSYGWQWMKSWPLQEKRAGFGAPWGVLWGKDQALCLVAIRNLQWDLTGSRIGSGCGVVAQSELDQEWRELFQKRLAVKKVLGFLP